MSKRDPAKDAKRRKVMNPVFWALVGAVILVAIVALYGSKANAQECVPGEETDGPIATKHSAVKKPGEPVAVSWALPTLDEMCEPLDGDTALTAIEFYASAAGPVLPEDPPTATLPASQTSINLSADAERGANIYYAVRACNDFGCSALSNQEFVKLPGRPKGGSLTDVN